MQYLYNLLYEPGIPLKLMGIIVGLALAIPHAFALFRPEPVKEWLRAFPRNEKVGIPMVIVAFAWSFVIWSCMDLGEFFKIERPVQMILIAGCIGVIVYVKEFIAVRSLGFLLILAAAPMLDSAFLQDPTTRLFLVAYAYVIAVMGMFWVGMPWLLRNQINWLLATDHRFRNGAFLGAAYGLLILTFAVVAW